MRSIGSRIAATTAAVSLAALGLTAVAAVPAAAVVGSTTTDQFAFAPTQTIAVTNNPARVATGDLNGDGLTDIVEAGSSSVSVVPNPAGTQSFAQTFTGFSFISAVAVADLTGDNYPDIIVASGNTPGVVTVFLNGGPTNPGIFSPGTAYNVGDAPDSIAIADLTLNGHSDIITSDFGSNAVSVLLNNGDGTFPPDSTDYPVNTDSTDGIGPDQVVVGDFNNDGNLDLATSDYGVPDTDSDYVSILYGTAGGGFGSPVLVPAGDRPYQLGVGKFDGSGNQNLAVLDYPTAVGPGTDQVQTLLNNGGDTAGAWSLGPSETLPNQSVSSAPQLVVTDMNGDNIPDAVVSDGSNVYIWPGTGDVNVLGSQQTAEVGSNIDGLAVADVNNDGSPDLVETDFNNVLYNIHEAPPTLVDVPSFSSQPLSGTQMTVSFGSWTAPGNTPISYNYTLDQCDASGNNCNSVLSGTDVAGPGFPYTPSPDQAGSTLQLQVTATDGAGYTGVAYSDLTNVIPTPPQNLHPPKLKGLTVIDGTRAAEIGTTVSVGSGSWSQQVVDRVPVWFLCPWGARSFTDCYYPIKVGWDLRIPKPVTGLQAYVAALVEVDSVGNATGYNFAGTKPVPILPAPISNVTPPTFSGTPVVGDQLAVTSTGTWTYPQYYRFSYQWQRCMDDTLASCTAIPGATHRTYVVRRADASKYVTVAVTAFSVADYYYGVTPDTATASATPVQATR